jgi:hypothetical protein
VIAHHDVKFTQCSDMAEWCGRSAASKH